MIKDITPAMRQPVLQLVRSVVVCLDIMRSHAGTSIQLHETITTNVVDLLLDQKYAQFRAELLVQLERPVAIEFLKRYAMVTILARETLELLPDLLDALHTCDEKFLLDLAELLDEEDHITRYAVANLLYKIIQEIERELDQHDHPSRGYGYGYGGYDYGYGGYGYGYGYGYGGYGYGYGYYGGYGPYGAYKHLQPNAGPNQRSNADPLDLTDENQLKLYQYLHAGIKDRYNRQIRLKEGEDLTQTQAKAILFRAPKCKGSTPQEQMFCAIAHASADPAIFNKLVLSK